MNVDAVTFGLRPRRRRRGLTLLEAIISTGIFVAAVALIGQLLQVGLESADWQRLSAIGLLRAESKIEEIVAGIEPAIERAEPIPFEDDPSWSWSVAILPTEVDGLAAATVTVVHRGVGETDETESPDFETRLVRLVTVAPSARPASATPAGLTLPPPKSIDEMLGVEGEAPPSRRP